jgi:hypothetical protein
LNPNPKSHENELGKLQMKHGPWSWICGSPPHPVDQIQLGTRTQPFLVGGPGRERQQGSNQVTNLGEIIRGDAGEVERRGRRGGGEQENREGRGAPEHRRRPHRLRRRLEARAPGSTRRGGLLRRGARGGDDDERRAARGSFGRQAGGSRWGFIGK